MIYAIKLEGEPLPSKKSFFALGYNCLQVFSFSVINENVSCTPQGVHGKQEYELWVVRLLEDSKLVQHVSASQWLMGSAKHLRVC